jgi:outer membrane lipoprotein-sorting protein
MKFVLSVLLFSFCFSQSLLAQSKSQTVLNAVSTKIKGLKSFYVEFSANVKNSKSGLNQNQTGKGWVKGQKFYASYGGNTIISNGVKTWTVVKDGKTVYISDANSHESKEINDSLGIRF